MRCFNCLGQHDTNCCPRNVNPNANRYGETIEKLGHMSLQRIDSITVQSLHITKIHISDDYGDLILDELGEIKNFLANQLHLIEKIYEILPYPRTTESNEIFLQGQECFKKGMFKESLYLLQEGIKLNPLDYRIHLLMAYLYTLNNDNDRALYSLEYYCLKTSPTDWYKSFTSLLIARLKYCMGDINAALNNAKLAIRYSTDYPEAYYQFAIYQTCIDYGLDGKVRIYLDKAIDLDKSYFIRAKIDKNFDSIRMYIDNFLKTKENLTKMKAEQEFQNTYSKIMTMKEWYDEMKRNDSNSRQFAKNRHIFDSIYEKIMEEKREVGNGFFDFRRKLDVTNGNKKDIDVIEKSIKDDLVVCRNIVKSNIEKIDENVIIINNALGAYGYGIIIIILGILLRNLNGILGLILIVIGALIIYYRWEHVNIGELKRYNQNSSKLIKETKPVIELAEGILNNLNKIYFEDVEQKKIIDQLDILKGNNL